MELLLAYNEILKKRIRDARDHWHLEPSFTPEIDLEDKVTFLKLAIERKQLQLKEG